jgi:hypothetical protein
VNEVNKVQNENQGYILEDDGLKTTYMQAAQVLLAVILSQFAFRSVAHWLSIHSSVYGR